MLPVQIVLFDGFDLLDAIAPYEVFSAAEISAPGALRVTFVTAEGPRAVTSGINGVKLEASGKLALEHPGILVVPGAAGGIEGDGPDSIPAILARTANTELTPLLQQALGQPDAIVATVCGGSLVLAMGGLIEGRPAVTHHLGMEALAATGAVPIQARVVDDGNLVTAGGVTSGLDLALYLVERELGPRIAHAVEQLFEYERRGTVWRAQGITPHQPTAVEKPQHATAPPVAQLDDAMQPSAFDGEWDTSIATPVGKMLVKLRIATTDGAIHGTATQGDDVSELLNAELRGNLLCWSLRIAKPMHLNLKFEVSVDGDQMSGIAKAGLLPASKLTGMRIS
ncbi:ThiJ/PfpI domain protein [Paenibacillus curdlanolyticus YK9]|uniref:ThiJ/PfpI domain protein n=1 Tax=Paenibacillus curdlanolyticus YK9 TaxID=717606 RepID=E0IF28_9BACL|nr:DJ-1/PfpI family protein [Paenibacillus curdlanolyticus]EFM08804.1 ThiJ/PfpI domain protein [Paenibacillus curdlanolyticus YK9]